MSDPTEFTWPSVLGPLLRRQDLTEAQAATAMRVILAGEATPAQIAAFATGLRIKGETVDEVTGLVRAMLAAAARVEAPGSLLDTCGTGGDRAGTFNVSTLAALVAVGAGCRVAKHGNRALSGRCGSADLLEALGVAITLPPAGVAATIAEAGIGFCFAPVFHPAMRHAATPRRELGVPTVFNYLGPLTNPARAQHQALGVADARMGPVMANVLARTGVRHALVFWGHDGLDELTVTTTSTLLEVDPAGQVREQDVDPAALGLDRARRDDLAGGDVERNVAIARAVLAGQGGPPRDMVLLNAAAALVAADAAASLADGMELAARSIDSGRARQALDVWVDVSRRVAKDLG